MWSPNNFLLTKTESLETKSLPRYITVVKYPCEEVEMKIKHKKVFNKHFYCELIIFWVQTHPLHYVAINNPNNQPFRQIEDNQKNLKKIVSNIGWAHYYDKTCFQKFVLKLQ